MQLAVRQLEQTSWVSAPSAQRCSLRAQPRILLS